MITFKINENSTIFILSSVNPTPDDALSFEKMVYQEKNKKLYIGNDQPIGFMEEIRGFFTQLLENKLELDTSIRPYSVGNQYAILTHKFWNASDEDMHLYDCDIFYKYSLTGKTGIAVFVYNHNQKIIMEISPYYKWDTIDLDELPIGTVIPTFEEFMQNYKPIAIHEISKETAQKWIKQADDYIKVVEAQYPEWCKKNKDSLFYLKHDT